MAMVNRRTLYKLVFPNGKVYIGCTNNIKTRWAGKGAHYRKIPQVYDAIQEFGWKNIKKIVIATLPDTCESDTAIKAIEKEFIEAYEGRCYNLQSNPEWHKENKLRAELLHKPKTFWTLDGIHKPACEWCEEYGITYSAACKRMRDYGLTLMQALTFPKVPREKRRSPIEYWRSMGLLE